MFARDIEAGLVNQTVGGGGRGASGRAGSPLLIGPPRPCLGRPGHSATESVPKPSWQPDSTLCRHPRPGLLSCRRPGRRRAAATTRDALCLFAPTETFESFAGLLVEPIADSAARAPLLLLAMLRRARARRGRGATRVSSPLGRTPAHSVVRGHDADLLGASMLGRESLQQIVGMHRIANLERADLRSSPAPSNTRRRERPAPPRSLQACR